MPCFVNLPLRWVYTQPLWVEWFISGNIAPEFGLDADSVRLPRIWHEKIASSLCDAGLPCAVHLPFMEIDPCDLDKAKAREARGLLKRGAELARLYGAKHMIGHPSCNLPCEGVPADDTASRWMDMALAAWGDLPDIGNATLFLENTHERAPGPIVALVAALGNCRPIGNEVVGVCFDVGHWHAFAGFASMEDLAPWLDAFAGFPLHLHLHDNNGASDQHIGMGLGTVPLEGIFAALVKRGKAVTATLEPHDLKSFVASAQWLEAHPAAAKLVGWKNPCFAAMPLDEIEKNVAK